jgi:hypothetical protein
VAIYGYIKYRPSQAYVNTLGFGLWALGFGLWELGVGSCQAVDLPGNRPSHGTS